MGKCSIPGSTGKRYWLKIFKTTSVHHREDIFVPI